MNSDFCEAPRRRSHSLDDPPQPGGEWRSGGGSPPLSTSIREVLACIDGSEFGCGVVSHAQVVAQAFGARLTLLHVLEPEPVVPGAPSNPLDWEIRRREARAHLRALTAPMIGFDRTTRSELITGHPAMQICAWAEDHDIDLTVLCSHGVRGVTDWDLAGTARKLIERAPGSLLLVPAAAAVEIGEVRYRHILVPVDGSIRAESVVPFATRIAALRKAELIFAHIVPVPEIARRGSLDAEGAELEHRVTEHNHRVASEYLDRLRARTSHAGLRAQTIVTSDRREADRLQQLVREKEIDLVVMAAHGHSGRTDTACGHFTEHALTHATTPLVVIRERAPCRHLEATPQQARPTERLATPHLTNP